MGTRSWIWHRWSGRRRLLPALIVGLAVGLLLAGCTSAGHEGTQRDGRTAHRDGEGPLAVAGGGGNSILAPKGKPWVATFGWAHPCTTTGEPITIDAVRYDFEVEPLSVRSVAFDARRYRGATGIGSTVGAPQRALARGEVRGKVLGPADDLVVTESCDRAGPDRALQILTVLEVGAPGAEVSDYAIDYTTEGEEYTLHVDWRLVACGAETPRGMCRDA